jgi:DNA-binding CsgD family transcriptional regulator
MYRATQKRATIAELNLDITRLQQESEALAETNRDNLFRKVMMIYKVFLIGENKDIDKPSFQKLKSCVCGQANSAYDVIFEEYNKVYPDVVQRIKSNVPPLSEGEFKICILSMMPFSVKEVADMMKVSTAMVGKARTSIRKKLGMTEARGSIEEFVLEMKKG